MARSFRHVFRYHASTRYGRDFDTLAAGSAGFSGADIISAVVNASATVARGGDPLR